MKLGIMQPYFLPYIGYWQLLNMVDTFVVYDNIEFTKKGWMHRNTLSFNGKREYFTINLKKSSDFDDVRERYISDEFRKKTSQKICNKIKQAYRKAPYFNDVMPIIEEDIFKFEEDNLFLFIMNSISRIASYLEINTNIVVSSTLELDHSLKGVNRVLDLCRHLGANEYINPIGGIEIYDKAVFKAQGVDLRFLEAIQKPYVQTHSSEFQPYLSFIDAMMFNSAEEIKGMLDNYKLI